MRNERQFSEYTAKDVKREVRTLGRMKPKGKVIDWFVRVHNSGATLCAKVQTEQGIEERGTAL